jgi:hypothetical protein
MFDILLIENGVCGKNFTKNKKAELPKADFRLLAARLFY